MKTFEHYLNIVKNTINEALSDKLVITDNNGNYITAKFDTLLKKLNYKWTDNIEFAYTYDTKDEANQIINILPDLINDKNISIVPFKRPIYENNNGKDILDEDKLELYAINFLNTYGMKYINNNGSLLEFLQNNDEDHANDLNIKKLKTTLNTLYKSSKDNDGDTIHNIPVNGQRIEYFVEYLNDKPEIQKYVLNLNPKDWIRSRDGYTYFVTDIINRTKNINESIEHGYNIMSLTIPPINEWFDVQLTPIIGDTCKAFQFLSQTWCIKNDDLDWFVQNISKTIKFKYMKDAFPRYMEFVTLL